MTWGARGEPVFTFDPWRDGKRTRATIARNSHARRAVETLPPYIGTRSDNIDLLAPNLAAMRPFLKGNYIDDSLS